MHDEQNGHNSALTELRRKLTGGLARARLNQTQLAARAELGRTTVSEALSDKKPVPSRETVAALARALKRSLSVTITRGTVRAVFNRRRKKRRSCPAGSARGCPGHCRPGPRPATDTSALR